MLEPHGTRPLLYKIRRLVDGPDRDYYEFWCEDGTWVPLQMDGFAFMDYKTAQTKCESFKCAKDRPGNVIYHSVVPVGGN